MKKVFQPAALLFYFLVLMTFLLLGMTFAGFTDAAKGQGLAGGTIILGYGVLFAVIALPIAVFMAYRTANKSLVIANKILAVVLIIAFSITTYRYQVRNKKNVLPPDQKREVAEPTEVSPKVVAMNSIEPKIQKSTAMGMGFFVPNFYEQPVLYFYGNLNLKKSVDEHSPYDSITFKRDKYNNFEIETAPPWLVPHHLKMDYGLLYFKIQSVSRDFIEVIGNTKTGQTTYFSRSAGKIVYWREFLLGVHSVEFIEGKEQPVKVKPLDHAGDINTKFELLRPTIIEGHWMQVDLYNNDYKKVGSGWIQWKKNNNLLIQYSLLS